jgi:hypothetical protein
MTSDSCGWVDRVMRRLAVAVLLTLVGLAAPAADGARKRSAG